MLFASDFSGLAAIFYVAVAVLTVLSLVLGVATMALVAWRLRNRRLMWFTPLAVLGWAAAIGAAFFLFQAVRAEWRRVGVGDFETPASKLAPAVNEGEVSHAAGF